MSAMVTVDESLKTRVRAELVRRKVRQMSDEEIVQLDTLVHILEVEIETASREAGETKLAELLSAVAKSNCELYGTPADEAGYERYDVGSID